MDKPGRIAAFEFMFVDDAIKNFIVTRRPVQIDSHIQTHEKKGMQLLDTHLYKLFQQGVISSSEALQHARKQDEIRKKMNI